MQSWIGPWDRPPWARGVDRGRWWVVVVGRGGGRSDARISSNQGAGGAWILPSLPPPSPIVIHPTPHAHMTARAASIDRSIDRVRSIRLSLCAGVVWIRSIICLGSREPANPVNPSSNRPDDSPPPHHKCTRTRARTHRHRQATAQATARTHGPKSRRRRRRRLPIDRSIDRSTCLPIKLCACPNPNGGEGGGGSRKERDYILGLRAEG